MAEAHSLPAAPAPAEEGDDPPVIPPLTRQDYKRLPAIEGQIAGAHALDATELVARARELDAAEPAFLPPEAIVYFIRRADTNGDLKTRDLLIRALLERCQRFFRSQFRGFDPAVREDLQGEVIAKLIEDLLAQDDRGDFMQVRFWRYLRLKSIDACRAAFRHSDDTESLDSSFSGVGESEGRTLLDKQAVGGLTAEQRMMLAQGLEQLPERLRQVFLLRHAVGMKIGSDNPEDDPPFPPTLARHFGRSGRTIRDWLKQAENHLTAIREKNNDLAK